MKAKEPTAAYYTPSMVHALQRSIANRISHENKRNLPTSILTGKTMPAWNMSELTSTRMNLYWVKKVKFE